MPPLSRVTISSVAGLLACGLGCSGTIGAGVSAAGGGSSSGAAGSAVGPGTGGGHGGGSPGPAGQGITGLGGDPYAIPASPPAAALVPTPRVARLSRQQWSNAVRDLLLLADISDVDSSVTGDALIGFDDE